MTKVFIDGSAGTTGLRIADRLAARKDIELMILDDDKRKDPGYRAEMINSSDVSFLCLPDDAARESVSLCTSDTTVIIDASTAHRTDDAWAYGFPELSDAHRKNIKNSKRIANPGCHASGFAAIVYPLVASGIIDASYPIVCHSLTGYSGGGKGMIKNYEDEARDVKYEAPSQYALAASHKHLPEMKKICGLSAAPAFNPIVGDFYSGMAVTVPLFASLMKKTMCPSELREFYADYYSGSKIITVDAYKEKGTEDGFLYANALSGKDKMRIIVAGNDERPQITALFCNLGKGASGAAIQCMNINIGADETEGLVL